MIITSISVLSTYFMELYDELSISSNVLILVVRYQHPPSKRVKNGRVQRVHVLYNYEYPYLTGGRIILVRVLLSRGDTGGSGVNEGGGGAVGAGVSRGAGGAWCAVGDGGGNGGRGGRGVLGASS